MLDPSFLSKEDILSIHRQEIQRAGDEPNIRKPESVEACTEAPKATFGGEYLNGLFEMAATYISCLAIRHPFVDGNKRTALASVLTFLYLNGYEIEESFDYVARTIKGRAGTQQGTYQADVPRRFLQVLVYQFL